MNGRPPRSPLPPARQGAQRTASLMVFATLALFAFSMAGALANYPGGSAISPKHLGYSFIDNFWCDALRDPALNGLPNPRGARLASIAIWTLGAGLIPFWQVAAQICLPRARARLRGVVQIAGALGMLGLMGIVLVPSDRFPLSHGVLVTIAGPCGLIAGVVTLTQAARHRRVPAWMTALGTGALLFAFLAIAQYARQFWWHSPPAQLLPLTQKLSTILFLAWVVSVTSLGFVQVKAQERRNG